MVTNNMEKQTLNYYTSARVRKGFIHFIAGKGISSIASFLVAIIIVRELPVTQYATYTAILGLIITLMLLSNLGIERAVPKFLSQVKQSGNDQELRELTLRLIIYRLAALIVVVTITAVCSDYLLPKFQIKIDDSILIAFCLYSIGYGISMHLIRTLQAFLMQKEATLSMSIEWFIKLAILLTLILNEYTITLSSVIYIHSFSVFLSVFYSLFKVLKYVMIDNCEDVADRVINDQLLFRFSLNNYCQMLAGFHCTQSTNKLIGSALLVPSSVAALGFTYSIIGVFKRYLPSQLFLGLIEPVVMGRFSRSGDFNETRLLTSILFKINLFLLTPALVWVFADGKHIIDFITKGKYGDSAWLVGTLLIGLILESHRSVLQMISNAIDKSELLLSSNLYTLIMLPIIILLTKHYQLNGFVVGILSTLFVRNIILEIMLSRLSYELKYDLISLLKLLVISLASVLLVEYLSIALSINSVFLSLLNLVVIYIIYFSILLIYKPFKEEERNMINKFIGRNIFRW